MLRLHSGNVMAAGKLADMVSAGLGRGKYWKAI